VGIVESGSEVIHVGVNPWDLFAVQERQRLAQYFNSYQFAACRTLIQEAAGRLSAEEKQRFEVLKVLVDGYEAWERFKHSAGLNRLEQGLAELRKLANVRAESFLASLAGDLASNVEFLRQLKAERQDAQELHPLLLSDLLANAKRRIAEGKFDDAAARLYRLVEMIGQLEIQQRHGAKTENFPLEQIPESLRADFERRYRSPRDGKIKLGMEATYTVLKEQGVELGVRFFQERDRFDRLQQARNRSILAHGVTPLEEERARELLAFVESLLPSRAEPRFPKLLVE
jgi:CRISPR-associated protein (TIGR02710 family)